MTLVELRWLMRCAAARLHKLDSEVLLVDVIQADVDRLNWEMEGERRQAQADMVRLARRWEE